jgi:hypothetical protein
MLGKPTKTILVLALLVLLTATVQTTFAARHHARKMTHSVRNVKHSKKLKRSAGTKRAVNTLHMNASPELKPAILAQSSAVAQPSAVAQSRPVDGQPAVAKKATTIPPAPFEMEWTNQGLTINCVQASLNEVLRAVSAKTGFTVRGLDSARSQVSAEFQALPFLSAMGVLLKGYNYVALGDFGPRSQEKPVVVIIGPVDGTSASLTDVSAQLTPAYGPWENTPFTSAPRENVSTRTSAGTYAMSPVSDERQFPPAPRDSAQPEISEINRMRQFAELETAAENYNLSDVSKQRLMQALSSTDPAIQVRAFDLLVALDPRAAGDAALSAVRNAPTANSRLQALQFLEGSRVAHSDLVNALSSAATDSDSEVRNFAILALGRHGGDLGLSVLSDLLRTPDPSTRLLVLQSAAQTRPGRVVVSQATEDSDPAVRHMAFDLLDRMSGQP